MEKIDIHFENCYGIKKLKHSFDFLKSKVQLVYAPNGAMKSSFAKTLEDISADKISQDRIFKDRVNHRSVFVDEKEINKDEIFVINRMQDADFKEASTILVNEILKNEYDELNKTLSNSKTQFLKNLMPYFGLKESQIEQIIIQAFNKDLLELLEDQANEIKNISTPIYTDILFNEVFNEKAYRFLKEKSFNIKIKEYISIYEKLINENNSLFKKGDFNHFNADNITKSLKDNGFFKAQHKVKINDKEIGDIENLETIIKLEKEKVLSDPELTSKFNEIDKVLNANNELRGFRSYVENHQEIIKEFIDLENFRKKLILNYIATYKSEFDVFLKLILSSKTRRQEIISEARKEQSDWINVLDIFNNRFTVPFKIKIKNQEDVILKNDLPVLIFTYIDGTTTKDLGGTEINESLSTGEQRVFYLLNIIFQIEMRKKIDKDQLVIVDDIADSFDYKNKYAIIEYLKDIAEIDKFKMIIFTHNFDFYKTIKKRLEGINNWEGNFRAIKHFNEIKLIAGEKQDVFPLLRKNYADCEYTFASCIPFVRNLIEYTVGKDNLKYLVLTNLLHIKPANATLGTKSTKDYTVGDILAIYNSVFGQTKTMDNTEDKVFNLVIKLADKIILENENVLDIKSKLCLSIAIRYKTEDFILKKITSVDFLNQIQNKETGKIVGQYKNEFPTNQKEINLFDRVNLMTAENIHVNSFMYEPLMDLTEEHLRSLYQNVTDL